MRMRGHGLVMTLLAGLPAAQGTSSCSVQIDEHESQHWQDYGAGIWHFVYRAKVLGAWPPFAHIKFEWPQPVEIQNVWDAEACTEQVCTSVISVPGDTDSTVTAQLGPIAHETMSVGVQGTGATESGVMPVVSCLTESEWSVAPPPSPPHADDCDLHPQYSHNSWDGEEMVTITFGTWSDREISVFYWGQTDLQVSDVTHASVSSSSAHNGGTLIVFTLGKTCHIAAGSDVPAADAPDGTNANAASNSINCVPQEIDAGHQRLFQFKLRPPALHQPSIICHDPWSPPPPPPKPPSPPPSPSPPPLFPSPPPPPMSVVSDGACPLGGVAVVETTRHAEDDQELRHIEVHLDRWIAGYEVVIGASGYMLDVPHEKYATLMTPTVDEASGVTLLTFSLHEEAREMFQFTISGTQIKLDSMTCHEPAPAPTPSSVHDASPPDDQYGAEYEYTYYYEDYDTQGGADGDGIVLTPAGPVIGPPAATKGAGDAGAGPSAGIVVVLLLIGAGLFFLHRRTPGGLMAVLQKLGVVDLVQQLAGKRAGPLNGLNRRGREMKDEEMEDGDLEDGGEDREAEAAEEDDEDVGSVLLANDEGLGEGKNGAAKQEAKERPKRSRKARNTRKG